MFSGLIEDVGIIKSLTKKINSMQIEILVNKISDDLKIGDSVAVDGICLTIKKIIKKNIFFDVMHKTIELTNIKNFYLNKHVNLERAMKFTDRFHGHLVSGHIDNIARVSAIKKIGISYEYEIIANKKILNYLIKQGSIAINGVSLTISNIKNNHFYVSIIPQTYEETNFQYLKVNDIVNLEIDMIAKYVEKLVKK